VGPEPLTERAALDERNARGLGPRRSDEWLAEISVDAAVMGVKVGGLWM
jgi:hypothetical protein